MNPRSRKLTQEEIHGLEQRGCSAAAWSDVYVTDRTDLRLIRNVRFEGSVSLGQIDASSGALMENVLLRDVRIGADPRIRNVGGGISGYRISDNVIIENVCRLTGHECAPCGLGTEVSVLDETGSRSVRIYPGINVQMAMLRAFFHHSTEDLWNVYEENLEHSVPEIGAGAVVRDCGVITDVNIDGGVRIEGATELVNGSVVNNVPRGVSVAYVGAGVCARNFIFEDALVTGGADIINTYVGQCATVARGFSAHDCLIFSNCVLENGEACAVIAGPYTVSVHKSTLLIGAVYSFMNAGSATNFSNHLYKLGPVHWGISERGVKMASGAYVMWGGRLGAFSMVMGSHKYHPDTTCLPFSYLFADENGRTVVVPARMLASSGLMRDEKKWPLRDRRKDHRLPARDIIRYETLTPYTVGRIIEGVEILEELLAHGNGEMLDYNGLRIPRSAAEKGVALYMLAVKKYYYEKTRDAVPSEYEMRPGEWTDICGDPLPVSIAERALSSETPAEAMEILSEASEDYLQAERGWIAWKFRDKWLERMEDAAAGAVEFDRLREVDRAEYIKMLQKENSGQSLF